MPASHVTASSDRPDRPNGASPVEGRPASDPRRDSPERPWRAASARLSGGVSMHSFVTAWAHWASRLAAAPDRQHKLAAQARDSMARLISDAARPGTRGEPPFAPKPHDHRFDHPDWQKPPFRMWQQGFLAIEDWWDAATDSLPGLDRQDARRARFMARQMLDVMSPSNCLALNPEIIAASVASGGQNLVRGLQGMTKDLGQVLTQSPDPVPEGFDVGTFLAATPGRVVLRTDLFELIRYAPQTAQVWAEPVLIVPACIMKYYVLDLSARNSLVRDLVAQGFTVFLISWCNPTEAQATLSLDDYRRDGVMAALQAVTDLLPGPKVHAVGYCLGGTMLAIAAAGMAREDDNRLASITLMAAQIDFAEAGELLLFADEVQVSLVENLMAARGAIDRPKRARTFSVIRSDDLIWTRAMRRYFLGEEDHSTDMGVWLADPTRMPATMHSQYLRRLFLGNRLSTGRFEVEGEVISMTDIRAPMFVIATEADHIAPWHSVYMTQLFTVCDLTFVLTNGGHTSGIVNPPGTEGAYYRWSHRPADGPYMDPEDWLEEAPLQDGSWWPCWQDWLADHSSTRAPPKRAKTKDLGAAPGSYVFQA